jgi:hypothetical protein
MPTIEWVTPAPLWPAAREQGTVAFGQPRLVKLAGDDFIPAFLDAMSGPAANPTGFFGDPAHGFDAAQDKSGTALKLYHPAHGRYYLAVASLVCRQLGLPDRAVARQNGDAVSFVIRRRARLANGALQEQGWVDEGPLRGWQPLVDGRGNPVAVRADEERLPAHPVQSILRPGASRGNGNGNGNGAHAFGASPFAALAGDRRTLYYGYIPVGYREKYAQRRPAPAGSPAQIMADYQAEVRAASAQDASFDYRMDEVTGRVLEPWAGIKNPAARPAERLADTGGNERLPTVSLYLILDLADWLARYVPETYDHIVNNATLAGKPNMTALVNGLKGINLKVRRPGAAVEVNVTLFNAIKELKGSLELVRGVGTEPADRYNVRDATFPASAALHVPPALASTGTLHGLVSAALGETTQPADVPAEVVELLANQVVAEPPDDAATDTSTYFLRFVYERQSPDGRGPCEPEVSADSPAFVFARYFDPDAPARHIRIQLPSMNMKDLRKYKRGVGLEMGPELRDVANRIHKGLLDGDGLAGSGGGWELGWICSFSLQIIFLVAFIVMFIFLIALNFIFWWLPFLKICFPIPRRSGS